MAEFISDIVFDTDIIARESSCILSQFFNCHPIVVFVYAGTTVTEHTRSLSKKSIFHQSFSTSFLDCAIEWARKVVGWLLTFWLRDRMENSKLMIS